MACLRHREKCFLLPPFERKDEEFVAVRSALKLKALECQRTPFRKCSFGAICFSPAFGLLIKEDMT